MKEKINLKKKEKRDVVNIGGWPNCKSSAEITKEIIYIRNYGIQVGYFQLYPITFIWN